MSRKPAPQAIVNGTPPRQLVWDAVRHLREFDMYAIRGELPGVIKPDLIGTYLRCLVSGGFLDRIQLDGRPGWRLKRDNGIEAPRLREDGTEVVMGIRQAHLWRALRMSRGQSATARAWAFQASTPECPIKEDAAVDYLGVLAKAGYLDKHGVGREARFSLRAAHWEKPEAPQIQRTKHVYDPNERRVVWRGREDTDDELGPVFKPSLDAEGDVNGNR